MDLAEEGNGLFQIGEPRGRNLIVFLEETAGGKHFMASAPPHFTVKDKGEPVNRAAFLDQAVPMAQIRPGEAMKGIFLALATPE
jgi:hypothetical protein